MCDVLQDAGIFAAYDQASKAYAAERGALRQRYPLLAADADGAAAEAAVMRLLSPAASLRVPCQAWCCEGLGMPWPGR
jgi:hypothetical protein